jgi:hypothetical protein
VHERALGGPVEVAPALVDVLAQVGVRLGDLAVDGEVHEVLALVVAERSVHEAELGRRLLDSLGEVTFVEGEPKLAVLEHVVRAGLVVASPRGVHDGQRAGGLAPPASRS